MTKRTADPLSFPPNHAKRLNSVTTEDSLQLLSVSIDNAKASLTKILQKDDTTLDHKLVYNSLLAMVQTCAENVAKLEAERANNSAEEQERRRSLVLIGLPEQSDTRSTERARKDQDEVIRVLDSLEVEAEPVAVYRLGRPNVPARRGPRLFKVVLPASVFRNIALGSWKRKRARMREQVGWEQLLVRPSLTKAELEQERTRRTAWALGAIASQMNANDTPLGTGRSTTKLMFFRNPSVPRKESN